MLAAEALEEFGKIIPWLNENPYHDRSIPFVERGLKDGAPESVKSAYAEFLAMEEESRKTGRKF